MKKQYSEPEFNLIGLSSDDFLAMSPDDEFGGNVDAEIPSTPPSGIF